jgi:TPR repeat protein
LAEQGHAGAQYNLGISYFCGQGVLKDKVQSKYWTKKAYENNDPKNSRMALMFWNEILAD